MRVTFQHVSDNYDAGLQGNNDVRPLSTTCILPANETTNPKTTISESASRENMMAIMISQYRFEAVLGGDTSEEDNPLYVSEW